jgi:hypothetical protein
MLFNCLFRGKLCKTSNQANCNLLDKDQDTERDPDTEWDLDRERDPNTERDLDTERDPDTGRDADTERDSDFLKNDAN